MRSCPLLRTDFPSKLPFSILVISLKISCFSSQTFTNEIFVRLCILLCLLCALFIRFLLQMFLFRVCFEFQIVHKVNELYSVCYEITTKMKSWIIL